MSRTAVAVVGAGKFALDALQCLLRQDSADIRLVVDVAEEGAFGASLSRFCARRAIPFVAARQPNDPQVLRRLAEAAPDIAFSLNNFRILKPDLLAIPTRGFVNFHNGPLPRYGGVNVCSWAIINGETRYGVTWHYLDQGIDTGDIIAQRFFDLADDCSVFELMKRCTEVGLRLFGEILPALLSGRAERKAQASGADSYYSHKDTPSGGRIDLHQPFVEIERLVRGLNFYPVENPFIPATLGHQDRRFVVLRLVRAGLPEGDRPIGEILAISDEMITVNASDAAVGLVELTKLDGTALSISETVASFALRTGTLLA